MSKVVLKDLHFDTSNLDQRNRRNQRIGASTKKCIKKKKLTTQTKTQQQEVEVCKFAYK